MKVGILTFYHDSINYGGLLQAYALTTYLRRKGVEAEQICFKNVNKVFKTGSFLNRALRKVKFEFNTILLKCSNKEKYQNAKKFREKICHSKRVYSSRNIKETVSLYDAFLTGSDQVWNPDWICDEYFLSFVPDDKIKVAYAVSIGKNKLEDAALENMRLKVHGFNQISVREESAVNLLRECQLSSTVSVDPTFLLHEEEWNDVVSPRSIQDEYIFCYFLGSNSLSRKCAIEFSKMTNLKIAFVGGTNGANKDKYLGIYDCSNAGPDQFLSLIKNAKYIFTDSFHCSVFSLLFKKNFVVFQREENTAGMSGRIYDLLKLYDASERFCDAVDKIDLDYIMRIISSPYSKTDELVERLKMSEESLNVFLN